MTRDEFVQMHGDKYLALVMRAFAMSPSEPLSGRWLAGTIGDLNGWLGTLHDSLTEAIANARKPDGAAGKHHPPQTGGGKAGAAPAR